MHVVRVFLLVFALISTVASPGSAYVGPSLPVRSLEAVEKVAVEVRPLGRCDAGTDIIVRVRFVADNKEFAMLTNARGFVLFDMADGGTTDAWTGVVRPNGDMVAVEYLPYDDLLRRYPDVCKFFTGLWETTL